MRYAIAALAILAVSQTAQAATSKTPVSIGRPHTCADFYPATALDLGIEGNVILAFNITELGTVENSTIAQSSGSKIFDDAALACSATWLYTPATLDGKPVATPWKAQVEWILPNHVPLTTMPFASGAAHACAARPSGTQDAHGETIVFFTVNAKGDVVAPAAEKSSGNAALDAYALSCVSAWTFYPATRDRMPISVEWYARLKW